MNYPFNDLRKIIFLFLKTDFSLAILQTFWKTPCEIERLQSAEMGFANMLAPSFKTYQKAYLLQQLQSSQYLPLFLKTFSSEVLLKDKSSDIVKLEQYLITDFKLYLSGGFRLIRRDFGKFEKKFSHLLDIERVSWVKAPFCSTAFKLVITVLFGILRDLRDPHNSLGLPIISESFSSKNACVFDVVNFKASYIGFICNYLSIWSLDFLNFLKSLFLRFNFSNASPSNHF